MRVGVAVDKYKNHPDAPANDCCFRVTYKAINKCPHMYYEVSDAKMFGDKVAAVLECLEKFRGEYLASGCVVLRFAHGNLWWGRRRRRRECHDQRKY